LIIVEKATITRQIGFFNLIYFVVELGRQLICLLDCLIMHL